MPLITLLIALLAGVFFIGREIATPTSQWLKKSQDPTSITSQETQAPTPLPTFTPSPTYKPTVKGVNVESSKPKPPTPTPILIPKPTSSNDYLSRLNKCLQDKANDPLNEEIKKDRELLSNPNLSVQEKAAAIARLDTNNLLLMLKYDCFGTNFKDSSSSDLEEAMLIKDIDSGDSVIIERNNGEQWLLEAKTWCSWCWREEGNKVYLKFGYSTSKLISEDGDISEFWTEDEL